jgi:hypothetical protein
MHSSPRLRRLVPAIATVAMAVTALMTAFMAGRSSGEHDARAQAARTEQRPTAAVLRTVVVAPPEAARQQPVLCDGRDCGTAPLLDGRF